MDLRNALSHLGKKPSPAECLSGALAIQDILTSHGQVTSELANVIDVIKSVLWLGKQERHHLTLSLEDYRVLLLDILLHEFMGKLSEAIVRHWDKQNFKNCPILPMELPEIKKELRKEEKFGGNSALRKMWPAYKALAADATEFSLFISELERVHDARKQLCHDVRSLNIDRALKACAHVLEKLGISEGDMSEGSQVILDSKIIISGDEQQFRIRIADSTDLIGREQMIRGLVTKVQEQPFSREIIYGIRGSGKTSIARVVCEKLQHVMPLQMLMHGGSVPMLRMDIARFGRLVSSDITEEASEEDAVKAALQYLQRHSGWLLLIDDAVNVQEIIDHLPIFDLCEEGCPAGHIIITTADYLIPESCAISGRHSVELFSTNISMELLSSRGSRGQHIKKDILDELQGEIRSFVETHIGNLPLGVAMLKSALSGQSNSSEARMFLHRCRSMLVGELGQQSADRYTRSLLSLLQEMLVRMEQRCNSPTELIEAMKILDILSLMDPQGVPDLLFRDTLCFSPHIFEQAVKLLVESGLATKDYDRKCTMMHSLVQICFRSCRTCGCDVAMKQDGILLQALLGKFDSADLETTNNWQKFRDLYVCVKIFVNQKSGAGDWLIHGGCRAKLYEMLADVSRIVSSNFKEARTLYLECLDLLNEDETPSHANRRAVVTDKLGSVHRELGLHNQALQYHETALAAFRGVDNSCPVEIGRVLNNLANVLQMMNRFEESLQKYHEALQLRRAHLGNSHISVAATLKNIGVLYKKYCMPQAALEMYTEALEIEKSELGDEHAIVAITFNNTGLVLVDLGRLNEALECYDNALRIQQSILHEHHVSIANTQYNMALLHQSRGNFGSASALFNSSAEIYLSVFGPTHKETMDAVDKSAKAAKKVKKLREKARLNASKALRDEARTIAVEQAKCSHAVLRRIQGVPGAECIDYQNRTATFLTFCTVGLPGCSIEAGYYYFEIELLRIGGGQLLMSGEQHWDIPEIRVPSIQVGWATPDIEQSDVQSGYGVGDDAYSWAADGLRCLKWGVTPSSVGKQGQSTAFGSEWKVGDVIGCACEVTACSIVLSVSVNGTFDEPNGQMFCLGNSPGNGPDVSSVLTLFPAISADFVQIRWNFGSAPLHYEPCSPWFRRLHKMRTDACPQCQPERECCAEPEDESTSALESSPEAEVDGFDFLPQVWL